MINEMNFSFIIPEAWESIIHLAVSCKQTWREDALLYEVIYPNGYGASIIKVAHGSYGWQDDLWELAVLKDDELCYDTYITDDVLGYLTDGQVVTCCMDIAEL